MDTQSKRPCAGSLVRLVVLSLLLVAGCSGGSASQANTVPSNDAIDVLNQRVAALNKGWDAFRSGVQTCDPQAAEALGDCFAGAYASSGINAAIADADTQIREIEEQLDPSRCRSTLERLDSRLGVLRQAIATMKNDAASGNVDLVTSDGHAVQAAWDKSLQANAESLDAC
jgi:outer membrane murein-binding lipoprotein Lpp